MPRDQSRNSELASPGYEIFIAALSLLSLLNILLVSFLRDDATQRVVLVIDSLLSMVFLMDFLFRLRRAPSRSTYFLREYGWADLLASLPFPQIKVLRIFRLIRVSRLLRRYGTRRIVRLLLSDRAGSALLSLLLLGILVLEFGSLLMLDQEIDAAGSNITTASDSIWYVLVTMSTVGYGDQYPVSETGRILGAFIIVVGVGIFGTLTGYLANLFLRPDTAATVDEQDATGAPAEDAHALAIRARELLVEQQSVLARLEAMLDPPHRQPSGSPD